MQGKIISSVTPQQKMVAVNNRFGNTNIKNQQGTTRVIYDSLPLDGRSEFRFFENANSRQYPLTNIGSEGNRLNVGETFALEKIYFAIIVQDADTGAVTTFNTFPVLPYGNWAKGEFSFEIANSQVVKQIPMDTFWSSNFNPTAENSNDLALSLFTQIIVPPLLEYACVLRTANYTAIANTRIACFIEGTAGILAPQTTF
jgi:hypothetical protein